MRIRKHQRRGNAGGESSSGAQRTDPGSQEQSEDVAPSSGGVAGENPAETVQTGTSAGAEVGEGRGEEQGSGPGVVVRPHARRGFIERVDSTSRSAFTWLDKLRHSKGFTDLEPYSNLEDFVSSLTKKDDGGKSFIPHSEMIVEGGDMSRLVGGVKAHHLVRHSSVCSESSSKNLNVGSLRPALESCDGSPVPTSITHRNERFNVQLQRNASLPNAAERSKDTAEASTDKISSDAPGMPSHGGKALERLLPNLADKYKPGEDGRSYKKSSSYWEPAGVNTSWMRDSIESSDVETRGYGESFGQKDLAGARSEKPLNHEISDVSCQPSTDEASLEQRHLGDSGDYSASIAKSVDTRHGALLQIASMQDRPSESTQRRSIRSRKILLSAVADEEQALRPSHPLSPDHPAQQTKDSLAFSLYTVFLRAGKAGLTAREAMADIGEAQRLAGVEDGAVQSSRRIAKLLRNSAYYMEVGEGRFALCTAVIDSQQNTVRGKSALRLQEGDFWQIPRLGKPRRLSESSSSTAEDSKSLASSEEPPAVQKKRKRAVRAAREPEAVPTEVRSKPVRTGRPKKLKYMKQENAESLGNQCNRTDGKGWVCPLLAKPGYQLCDHHLDKLRCKPGSRSKKKKLLKMAAAEAEAATSTRDETHSVDTARHEMTTP